MSTIIPKNDLIEDLYLHKYSAEQKMRQLMSLVTRESSGVLKTASSKHSEKLGLITLFSTMLASLNMISNEEDAEDIINKIATDDGTLDKNASLLKVENQERRDDIKIVSKSIKDSHYQVDISKDAVKQEGKRVFMVSCYARDAYLGRYLIKRNFFYTVDREKFADSAYDEIMTKVGAIKDRYYNEIIEPSGIFTQIKQILDGVVSEIEIKEDSIGTNYNRQ